MMQKQVFTITQMFDKQIKITEDLAEVVKNQKEEISKLRNDLSLQVGNFYTSQTRLDRLEDDIKMYNPWGSTTGKQVGRELSALFQQLEQLGSDGIKETIVSVIETVKVYLRTLPESKRAEILSIMASEMPNRPYPRYAQSFLLPIDAVLRESADILNQPNTILTLYR
jgi:hypothetical protein